MSAETLESAGFCAREQVPFASLTTLRVGGPCALLVDLEGPERLPELLRLADALGHGAMVLGGGSNLLVSDEGYDGTVVRLMPRLRTVALDGHLAVVNVSAGEDWSSFVEWCLSEGLSGVECLSGIPGTVGATPVQNVGAYGQEMAGIVRSVRAWDRVESRHVVLSNPECRFTYRDSIFKRRDRYIVTAVELVLERSELSAPIRYDELARALGVAVGSRAKALDAANAVLDLRRAKGMVISEDDPDTRSAGSFFTNPVLGEEEFARLRRLTPSVPFWVQPFSARGAAKVPAAWLIENAGFYRGYVKGRAAISSKHTLALVARDGARATDIVELAAEVRDGVHEHFGVWLQPEPVLVGLSF